MGGRVTRLVRPSAGWVLYDDSCGLCRRWVPAWEGVLRRRGFAIVPLQAEWVRERLEHVDGDPLDDFRLLLEDGRLISGADAYRYLMRRIWWARPLFVLSTLPLLRTLFDAAYRRFARHRHRLSEACGLPDP